jgi:ATP-dependent Clp protease ATP-binding subunit ClpA
MNPALSYCKQLIFSPGEYQDRRKSNDNKIDCSQTIWILATNALDPTISAFCQQNEQAIFHDEDETKKEELMKSLAKELRADSLNCFGVSPLVLPDCLHPTLIQSTNNPLTLLPTH